MTVQRTIRKDTAAYASLLLSTMSKSMSHKRLERTPGAPATLAGRPGSEASRRQFLKNRAVDEAYLVQGPVPVNSIRKKIRRSFSSLLQPHKYRQSNAVHENAAASVLICCMASQPAAHAGQEPQRSRTARPIPSNRRSSWTGQGQAPNPCADTNRPSPKAHAPGQSTYPPCQERTPSGPYSPKVALI
jgi:hypothetical protein